MSADDRSLSEVFKLFDLIHILTTDHETITRITKEVQYNCECSWGGCINLEIVLFTIRFLYNVQQVIEDFAADNVVYLELRTTPKVFCLLLEYYQITVRFASIRTNTLFVIV